MSNSGNYQCRVCFQKYRDCGSSCVPWEASGFGSPQCYYEWSRAEIERLKKTLTEWESCGAKIMNAIGKEPPLSDSDVIGEIEKLEQERDEWRAGFDAEFACKQGLIGQLNEARIAARRMYNDTKKYNPADQLPCEYWLKDYPWLEESK